MTTGIISGKSFPWTRRTVFYCTGRALKMVTVSVGLTFLLWTVTCHGGTVSEPNKYMDNVRLYHPHNAQVSMKKENSSQCNFPPSVWCSSRKIAKLCQVEAQCGEQVWSPSGMNQSSPVDFTLYLESLCPDCKQFVMETLWPAWKKIHTIMKLDIVPYGNAEESREGTEWKFTCQHGHDECVGNLIETCAIHILKKTSAYFPFIYCIEKSDDMPSESAPRCAKQLGINYKPIDTCSTSSLGNKLEHEMATRTNNLQPPHTFVPWVTLNGEHTDEIQTQAITNLVKLICDTYKGKKPDACKMQLNVHRKKAV